MKKREEVSTELPCACATARQVARALTQLYDARLREAGMEAPQFAMLMVLDKQGPCNQVDLGRRHALDKTTVSRNLKVLEKRGWIESAAGTDRRTRRFVLTAAGRKGLKAAMPRWKKAQEDLRSGMSGAEWTAMFRAFRSAAQAAQRLRA